MAKREIKNLALKIKLTKEFLENGGVKRIPDPGLLQDFINTRFDKYGDADPESITPRLNAFMTGQLEIHTSPPYFDQEHLSEYISFIQKGLFFEQQNVETKDQFDQFFADFHNKEGFVFRGQREAKWRLYNKAQRQWINDGIFNYDLSYRSLLEQMISLGRERFLEQIQATLGKTVTGK
ncbi:hypothetical protein BDE36_1327 [Arcticibacter tournemirensis]|uniref:Uncharacterized protein n=1 Tax=Arcticibacter tournemirensis TaxID=699437 RepID=A0A5M9GVI8_9SPHI|nr:hypothetical protein [Arcticibacter tournemirensis]KAA8476824.1 hypothetical protein F1649_19290 [Arcticibacter tournemirensis]TQM49607.1 hypothetical protein BDE36_1327 [Arcticibacter tournemirensis]